MYPQVQMVIVVILLIVYWLSAPYCTKLIVMVCILKYIQRLALTLHHKSTGHMLVTTLAYLKRKMFRGEKVSHIARTFIFWQKSFSLLHLNCLKFSNIRPFRHKKFRDCLPMYEKFPPRNILRLRYLTVTGTFAWQIWSKLTSQKRQLPW